MRTITEVADYFRVTRETVTSWILAGKLSAIDASKHGGKQRRWRISEQALRDFELSRTTKPVQRVPVVRVKQWV